MLSTLLSSLSSPIVPTLSSSRLPHFNSFVVLTKKSSHRRLSCRSSITSFCSTTSNSSDDESDTFDLETDDYCILYESYAAVTKRSNRTVASVRWSDLQLAPNTDQVAILLATLRLNRQHTRNDEMLELAALELCFQFLTLNEVLQTVQVCKSFHDVVTSSKTLLTGLYSRQWRTKILPETYVMLSYNAQLTLCAARQTDATYDLSTRTARNAYGFGSGEHVGWKGVSYGYHGNNGDFAFNDGTKPYGGESGAFGPSWGRTTTRSDNQENDESSMLTVGCGLDASKLQIFFTLNGEMIGTAPVTVLPGDYAAAVSLHAFGDEAVINVGSAPFRFDIESFCASP
ncbi:unnamed protein product [Peronospora destructor]|uniref:SPRY domain-containing protein n=1 Tax=Peronospora destructor TaxID=86335 RepID=A0AAV0V4Y2_9STRA|nr:unnamed protein product [Peronospora destructor]